jgi:hypothetical protein
MSSSLLTNCHSRPERFFVLPVLFLSLLLGSTISKAQTTIVHTNDSVPGTTVVIPGKKYNKSGYHNFLYGKHYRKEWNTPVRVPNFYLDTARGGLVPVKEGGSRQTMGLRLKDKNGKEYVLRSVDKDFGNGLPDEFHGTFIARIAKDQASIGYPFAAATITPMISVTGIYHTIPVFVFVPRQGALGKFNEKFGDQLYMIEERPDENQEDAPHFGNSKNVIGTEKLFEHIYEDNDNRVDQKAFVKARLFDMMIGDWGRHADQWRWASFKKGGETIYRPIPRDRDQAYTRFDGFYPSIAAHLFGATQLESYNYHISNTKKFNMPGRPLDRMLLNDLEKEDWITAAKELQQAITDQVIVDAVKQLPPELYNISGAVLTAKLKSHRDDLVRDAGSYYDYLSHHSDITGTQEKERFEINRLSPEQTSIRIYKINKEGVSASEPYYSRTFHKKETKEIRIYSLEKEDVIEQKGNSRDGVKIRIVDPGADDSFNNKQVSTGRYGRTKISAGNKFLFDTAHHKKFDFFILPLLSPAGYKVFDNNPIDLFTTTGIRISANILYTPQPWRKPAYEHSHLLSANYGFLRGAFNVGYVGRMNNTIGKLDLVLKARADLPAVENYYGAGNLSLNKTSQPVNYYSVKSERMYGSIGLSNGFGNYHYAEAGIFYQSVKVDKTGNRFIAVATDVDPLVFTRKQYAGVEGGYRYRHANSEIYPTKGVNFSVGGGYVQDLNNNDRSFVKGLASLSFYLPLSKSFTLAVRGGGATLNGDADYYHLNILGGNQNLRGYPRERFYAKSIFYNNNELRWVTSTHNFFFSGKIGLLAFLDNGRLWQPGETYDKFRTSYGGGLILVPFNKVALVGTYGVSPETTQILLQANVFF